MKSSTFSHHGFYINDKIQRKGTFEAMEKALASIKTFQTPQSALVFKAKEKLIFYKLKSQVNKVLTLSIKYDITYYDYYSCCSYDNINFAEENKEKLAFLKTLTQEDYNSMDQSQKVQCVNWHLELWSEVENRHKTLKNLDYSSLSEKEIQDLLYFSCETFYLIATLQQVQRFLIL